MEDFVAIGLQARVDACEAALQQVFVGQMPIGDKPQFAARSQRLPGDTDEGESQFMGLVAARVERRVADDDVIGAREPSGHIVPVQAEMSCQQCCAGQRMWIVGIKWNAMTTRKGAR